MQKLPVYHLVRASFTYWPARLANDVIRSWNIHNHKRTRLIATSHHYDEVRRLLFPQASQVGMSYRYKPLAEGEIRLLRFTPTGLDGFTRIELETHDCTAALT